MSISPEPRLDDTDDRLLRIAAGVLARSPSARTEDIAQALGLSRATLHRRFGRRDDLVATVRAHAEEQVWAVPSRAELERGEAGEALLRLLDALQDCAPFLAFLYDAVFEDAAAEQDPVWEETDQQILDFFARGQEAGAFRAELSPAWMSEAIYALAAAGEWSVLSGRIPRDEVARQVSELFLGGVRATT